MLIIITKINQTADIARNSSFLWEVFTFDTIGTKMITTMISLYQDWSPGLCWMSTTFSSFAIACWVFGRRFSFIVVGFGRFTMTSKGFIRFILSSYLQPGLRLFWISTMWTTFINCRRYSTSFMYYFLTNYLLIYRYSYFSQFPLQLTPLTLDPNLAYYTHPLIKLIVILDGVIFMVWILMV